MQHQFGRSEVAEILSIPITRIRSWERSDLVRPSLKEGRRVFYDFHDLICLRVVHALTDKQVPAEQIKTHVLTLKTQFGTFERRLNTKRIYVFANRVLISDRRRLIHAHSRNLLFKFDIQDLRREVDKRLAKIEDKTAQEWFREGEKWETRSETRDRAIHAFQQAVKLDPRLADAYIRMGSLYYDQRKFIDAQRCFRIALRTKPYDCEACFKLANVLDELNCTEESVHWYEKAVEIEPEFANAYFNLAAAAEKLGLLDRAIRAWRAYLQVEPKSRQAKMVRRRIEELEHHLATQA